MNPQTQPFVRSPDELVFGKCANPVVCGSGLVVGGGLVYPEINFTLPPMPITEATLPGILELYETTTQAVVKRARELSVPGLVIEFEHLPPMTENAQWGADITFLLARTISSAAGDMPTALRVTPVDVREFAPDGFPRPGENERLMQSFYLCAAAGADMLAIESTGGKAITDQALLECNLRGMFHGLVLIGTEDCAELWKRITTVACNNERVCIPSGDSACGFGNTAMVLAERGYIPRVFAAVVRVISAVRSAAAFENGAVGPSKDCAYEGVICKALTGVPISLEGKSATFAHLSPIGNVASATADLWSNESIEIHRVLSGDAVVASLEQLAYDCRLLNAARRSSEHDAWRLRDWLAESDVHLDPQAWVLSPKFACEVAQVIAAETTPHRRALAAARFTFDDLNAAARSGELTLNSQELQWLDNLSLDLSEIPDCAEELMEVTTRCT